MWTKKVKEIAVFAAILALGLACGYVAVRAPAWFKRPYTEGNFAAYYPDTATKVLVYGTSTCPYCEKTRALLKTSQVAFADFNIDKADKAKKDFVELKGEGVPLIIIGNRRIEGFDPKAIEAALVNVGIHPVAQQALK